MVQNAYVRFSDSLFFLLTLYSISRVQMFFSYGQIDNIRTTSTRNKICDQFVFVFVARSFTHTVVAVRHMLWWTTSISIAIGTLLRDVLWGFGSSLIYVKFKWHLNALCSVFNSFSWMKSDQIYKWSKYRRRSMSKWCSVSHFWLWDSSSTIFCVIMEYRTP